MNNTPYAIPIRNRNGKTVAYKTNGRIVRAKDAIEHNGYIIEKDWTEGSQSGYQVTEGFEFFRVMVNGHERFFDTVDEAKALIDTL